MIEFLVDAIGRKLYLRRIGVVEQLRLFKALGPDLSINEPYMHGAFIAAAVSMIDDVPMLFPSGEAGVEASLERIGLDAMALVAAAMGGNSNMVSEAGN